MKIRNKKSNTLLNLVSYELKDQIVIEPWPTQSDENPEIFLGFGRTGKKPWPARKWIWRNRYLLANQKMTNAIRSIL